MIKSHSLKRIGVVAGTLSAAVLLTITQASAVSAETERATAATGPDTVDSWECAHTGPSDDHTGTTCYSDLGDWLEITDGAADGSSAVMDWEIRDAQNRVVRFGATFNADGSGAVRYKNKDFPEANTTIRFRARLGHWSTKSITAGTCSAWMTRGT
ncbi:hypothetical protein AB5J56_04775 [Streptomyces sp. R21]|uniref:Secreted protein n=1 Tax=Streptomyces sp. R21 TaxID=3238627 RepID=A0AB39P077_9ACTN